MFRMFHLKKLKEKHLTSDLTEFNIFFLVLNMVSVENVQQSLKLMHNNIKFTQAMTKKRQNKTVIFWTSKQLLIACHLNSYGLEGKNLVFEKQSNSFLEI